MNNSEFWFIAFYITNENILVKKQVEEVFLMYRKSLVKLFKKYSATKEFDKKNEFANYTHLKHRMNAGETVKFLRDHSISELFIIPDEVVHIIREVNSKDTTVSLFSYYWHTSGRMPLPDIPRFRILDPSSSSPSFPQILL